MRGYLGIVAGGSTLNGVSDPVTQATTWQIMEWAVSLGADTYSPGDAIDLPPGWEPIQVNRRADEAVVVLKRPTA